MPYIPHTEDEIQRMLEAVGAESVEELFEDIPPDLRPKSFDLPPGLPEPAVLAEMERLAGKNKTDVVSFLGAGFYDHYIPAAVDFLSLRGEFYTAYTPYQPEASQGTLQAIFEYQTAICRLFDMDCANASSYDGGSSIFEAMMMAVRKTRREKLVISEAVNPIYRVMLDSYSSNLDLELVTVPHSGGRTDVSGLMEAVDDKTAAVVVQNPNFFGCAGDFSELFAHAREKGALSVISVYPVMQSVLKTPGEMGADVAVAEGQSLGMPLSFGGPYLGVMTCTKALVRQMPGRIVGRTVDTGGRNGYVLTLQAREQHIRRQKATSNICSNQALCALRALIHMSLLGPDGMAGVAKTCMANARYAARRLTSIPGVEMLSDAPFVSEFAIRLPESAWTVVDAMAERGYVPGFPLGRYYKGMDDCLLVACTEKHRREDIGIMAEIMGGLL
jgi:glycine dehydrogenase subunit 1